MDVYLLVTWLLSVYPAETVLTLCLAGYSVATTMALTALTRKTTQR